MTGGLMSSGEESPTLESSTGWEGGLPGAKEDLEDAPLDKNVPLDSKLACFGWTFSKISVALKILCTSFCSPCFAIVCDSVSSASYNLPHIFSVSCSRAILRALKSRATSNLFARTRLRGAP